MAEFKIYLPDDPAAKVRKIAKSKCEPPSRWTAGQIAQNLEDSWPEGILKAAGALPDFPSLKQIRKGYRRDVPRESLE